MNRDTSDMEFVGRVELYEFVINSEVNDDCQLTFWSKEFHDRSRMAFGSAIDLDGCVCDGDDRSDVLCGKPFRPILEQDPGRHLIRSEGIFR